ncbi:MAG: hypothetical protein JO327_13405 [Nitrososphaeraceae archaeon]|nr:hypothetical protein [Nitrososphaeraceae archaeon]MBV9669111.1 hypothetical protein [Nitrososphaeraceae archaeon]
MQSLWSQSSQADSSPRDIRGADLKEMMSFLDNTLPINISRAEIHYVDFTGYVTQEV